MRTKIIALLLTAGVLLAGCTPAASDGDTAQVTSQPASVAETQTTTTTSEPASTSAEKTQSNPSETSTSIVTSGSASSEIVWPEPATPTPIVPDEGGQAGDPPAEHPGPPADEEESAFTPVYNWPEGGVYVFRTPDEYGTELGYVPVGNNSGTPDDYFTVEYNVEDLALPIGASFVTHTNLGTGFIGMEQFTEIFPAECLRQLDENTFYAVYRIKQGGYFYVHFQKMVEGLDYAPPYMEGMYVITEYQYLTEATSWSDYADIQVGDAFEEVEAIEPALSFWKWRFASRGKTFDVRWTLTDGSVHVVFDPTEDGGYVVREIQHFPDGIEDFGEYSAGGLEVNYNILPQDFPQ